MGLMDLMGPMDLMALMELMGVMGYKSGNFSKRPRLFCHFIFQPPFSGYQLSLAKKEVIKRAI